MEFGLRGEDGRHAFEFPFSQFGRWTHVVLSYDQWRGKVTYFVDGRVVRTHGYHSVLDSPYSALAVCGLAAAYIDDLRIYGRGISDAEVSGLYSQSFLTGKWTFDYDGSDRSAFGNHGTMQGDADVDSLGSWRGRALTLDGAGDWVEVADTPQFSALAEELSFSSFVRTEFGSNGYVAAKGTYSDAPFFVRVTHGPTEKKVYIGVRTGAGSYLGDFIVPMDEEWHAIQLVYDSSLEAGNVKTYYGGQLQLEGDLTGGLLDNDHPLTFGRRSGTGDLMLAGHLDEIVLVSKALPPEVLETLRSSKIMHLPLALTDCDVEPDHCDVSPFHHSMEIKKGAYIEDGPEGGLYLDGINAFAVVRGHEVFGETKDVFTLEFDAYIFHDGQEPEFGPLIYLHTVGAPETTYADGAPATFLLLLRSEGLIEAHVGDVLTFPGCTFGPDDYNTWKHFVFRYDRFRSDHGLEEGELEVEGVCSVPGSAVFFPQANSVYHGEPLMVGGGRTTCEEEIGMKVRNIVLHRLWVD